MPSVWCRKCQDQPRQAHRPFCKSCEPPRTEQPNEVHLVLGCLSLTFGIAFTLGFFVRGCVL